MPNKAVFTAQHLSHEGPRQLAPLPQNAVVSAVAGKPNTHTHATPDAAPSDSPVHGEFVTPAAEAANETVGRRPVQAGPRRGVDFISRHLGIRDSLSVFGSHCGLTMTRAGR